LTTLPLGILLRLFSAFNFELQFSFNIDADCCDGSDEYDGTIHCPNTCVMGGNAENMYGNYNSKVSDQGIFAEKEVKDGVKSEESVHNVNGKFLSNNCFILSCGQNFA
jgi:hypothetical protein